MAIVPNGNMRVVWVAEVANPIMHERDQHAETVAALMRDAGITCWTRNGAGDWVSDYVTTRLLVDGREETHGDDLMSRIDAALSWDAATCDADQEFDASGLPRG